MTKFEIKVSQLLAGTITVTAKNAENAIKKVKKAIKNGEITFIPAEDVKIEIVSKAEKTSKKDEKKETAKEEPKKLTVADYENIIRQKKNDAHNIDWLYIEVDADLLLNEIEPGVDNIDAVVTAVNNEMLEGDYVVSDAVIENGKIVRPVEEITVAGNFYQMLKDIVAVGNDCIIDDSAWTCGKGQSVPVCCGMPTVLVNNLLVGGE